MLACIAALAALTSSLVVSCTGRIGSSDSLPGYESADGNHGGAATGGGGLNGGAGSSAAGKSGGGSGTSGGGLDPNDDTPAKPSPLSRLTSTQYNNTLQDLFAPVTVPTELPPVDPTIESFDNNAAGQTPSAAHIETYHNAAVAVSTAAMTNAATLLGCSPANRTDEDTCASTFLGTFAQKAYRRPLVDGELSALTDFYASTRTDGTDFASAMTLTIQAVLQSPSFLYRVELGKAIKGRTDAVALTGYEIASRISYMLWNTMPDEALLTAAANGQLDTAAGVETQVRRLLADQRAHDGVLRFHSQWLRFNLMDAMKKSPTLYPSFNDDTAAALRESAEKQVDHAFFVDGSFKSLLTDPHAFVNDKIADIYGVASPGPEMTLVDVDPTQRSGILTNAGLMAAFAHETADSPVLRGVFVLNSVMCTPMPPPPRNVVTTAPEADPSKPMTTRDRFAKSHELGTCASCHHTIDGIGFGFEHYDAVGAWRTQDLGLPVDSSGWFVGQVGDLTGTFKDAVELGDKLAASELASRCLVQFWMRYALGVDKTGVDNKGMQPVVDAFLDHDSDMRELVVALTKSEAFTTRLVQP